MSRARFAAVLLLAGLAACQEEGAEFHNSPDGVEGSQSSTAPQTLNDSLSTGEAIQTMPPPAETAQPTATDTVSGGAPVAPAPSGGAADTSTARP